MPAKLCRHIKTNGNQCKGVALRGKPFCYFHDRTQLRERRLQAQPALAIADATYRPRPSSSKFLPRGRRLRSGRPLSRSLPVPSPATRSTPAAPASSSIPCRSPPRTSAPPISTMGSPRICRHLTATLRRRRRLRALNYCSGCPIHRALAMSGTARPQHEPPCVSS